MTACGPSAKRAESAQPSPKPFVAPAPLAPLAQALATPRLSPACGRAMAEQVSPAKEPLQITGFFPAPPPTTSQAAAPWADAQSILREMERASQGKVQVKIVHATSASERDAANWADCTLQDAGASACITFAYREARRAIKELPPSPMNGLERLIGSYVRDVVDEGEGRSHRVGVLVGHGEPTLREPTLVPAGLGNATMLGFMAAYHPTYVFVDVDLAGGTREVDASLEGLLILQPASPLSEKELRAVDRFVMLGRHLAVFAGAANVKQGDPAMQATLDTHGLERLLTGYGIEMKRDVVVDFGSPVTFTLATSGVTLPLPFFQIPLASSEPSDMHMLDDTFPPLFCIRAVAVPYPSSLVLSQEKQKGARVRAVLRTSTRGASDTRDSQPLGVDRVWLPTTHASQFTVGAAVEGTVTSAFGTEASRKAAGVLVISSPAFFASPFARATIGAPPGVQRSSAAQDVADFGSAYAQNWMLVMLMAFRNTVDWMTGGSLAACQSSGDTQGHQDR